MTAVVIRADARELPLPDGSVDLIVTSPPYFGLRSYTDGGKHYAGQIGSEATPAEWLKAMLACTREWMRVLKPTGSIFVNLGDTYSGKANAGPSVGRTSRADRAEAIPQRRNTTATAPFKSLLLMPERYRIACIDELGLIARAVLVWDKPNGLPESVTDRVRRSHEDWVHLTKQPRYFSAVDEIREQHSPVSVARSGRNRFAIDCSQEGVGSPNTVSPAQACNPLGKLPGSVWTVPTEPLTVPDHLGIDHFAAFPTEWPRRIILGWSPSGICTACGEGRRPVSQSESVASRRPSISAKVNHARKDGNQIVGRPTSLIAITGEACACPEPNAPTTPSVIVDPFGGTGTTALVAHALGRTGITVDRSADYCRIAHWRTTDPDQIAKAMRVEKPPTEVTGQLNLLDIAMGAAL